VNDFDEASKMPYAIDLVRLAASALLAIEENSLKVGVEEALEALLIPYESAIKNSHGKPFVLEEDNPELRKMALSEARKPKKFWDKLEAGQLVEPPKSVEKILTKQMPEGTEFIRVRHRIAGLGSLGRPRYVMIGEWRSGLIAREAKAMLPPAYQWALGDKNAPNQYQKILDSAIRVPDPFVKIKKDYVLRRLSPHSSRIDLSKFPDERDDLVILKSMGKETANVHLGANGDVPQVAGDLELRPSGWLLDAAKRMVEATKDDWEYWRRHQPAEAEDAPAANAAPV
jgi:hypothetical protein